MIEWSHLPNSHHIDWVIESVKQNPKLWREAWREARAPARHAAFGIVWDRANDMTKTTVKDAAYAATDTRWLKAYAARWNAAREVASDALLTLVAYDDCDQYLNMGYEKLLMYAKLSEKPQAILLLPMVYVREKLGIETVENNTISI